MTEQFDLQTIELICVIINDGQASKLLHAAKHCGITGGTVLLGKGTAHSRLFDYLGLNDVRKEIVYMIAERKKAYEALGKLDAEFKFEKPNHGIAFTTGICGIAGTKNISCDNKAIERGVSESMYHVITVIVDKGKAEDAVDAATHAGAKGGTIINARGSGVHETAKVFSMDIEPEKEIVIILAEIEQTEGIVKEIHKQLKLEEPGNGIIYVQNVNKTYGIYK